MQTGQDRTGQAWTRRGLNKKNDYSNNGDPWGDPDPDRSDGVPEMYEDDLSDKERAHHEAKADRIVRDGYES
jgi:hypothetical protein